VSHPTNPAAQGRDFGSASYRWYVLITLTAIYTLNFIDRALLGVLAQPVISNFGLSDAEFGFLAGPPFALFYALMGIPIALAADRHNRVTILAVCIALWSLMTALCGFATGFLFLLIARVGVAIGEAGSTPPSNSLIGDYYRASGRAKALAIFSTGVMLGNMLAYLIGGPLGQMSDESVKNVLGIFGLEGLPEWLNWGADYGWRFAFIALGVPGVIFAFIVWLTVREPPRGYSDSPDLPKLEKTGIATTLRILLTKRSYWYMTIGASLIAMVGFGFASFQAPMMQRLHGLTPGEFAVRFGVPLSITGAVGTLLAGFAIDALNKRSIRVVALWPAVTMALAAPLYILAFNQPSDRLGLALALWLIAALLHYGYLGAQYTIGQGVVPVSSRASSIAIMLFIIALVGNGLGPQIVGLMSDRFMTAALEAQGVADALSVTACHPKAAALLTLNQQNICATIYAEGLQDSMSLTALFMLPAAWFFYLSSRTLDREMLAR
jgi:predicted MFS family arabinose efflux permease